MLTWERTKRGGQKDWPTRTGQGNKGAARFKKVKNDKKKETKAEGSRLFSLLLRPEGGWSAGWDRTRWLVARQPDFLSLSCTPPPSLCTRSYFIHLSLTLPLSLSLCSLLFVTRFRTGALLAFALTSSLAPPSFPLSSSIVALNSLPRSHRRAAAVATHRTTPHTHRLLSCSLSFSLALLTRHPLHTPERVEDSLSCIYLGRWL